MTRAIQKHVARRQDQTFADWFAELRELAAERWPDVADQAPTVYAIWGGGATPAQALYMGAHSPAEDSGSGGIITSPCRILGRGFSRIGGATMEISAWNSMKRARDLLTVAGCFAAKGVDDDDSCRDLADKFATLIDLIEDEVDNAMMMIPRDAARADAKPADGRPDA